MNYENTSPHPAVVLHSVGLDQVLPVESNSFIWDVMVETGLCKDMAATVSDFPVVWAAFVPFVPILFPWTDMSQKQS